MRELMIDGRSVAGVEMAVTAAARRRGLLGRTDLAGALWLAPARQVHTYRMKFAIDVAHVNKRNEVIHVATMAPGKLGRWSWGSRGVIEAPAGAFAQWGVRVGTEIAIVSTELPVPSVERDIA